MAETLKRPEPCWFFSQGKCNKGAACLFRHDQEAVAAQRSQQAAVPDCKYYLHSGDCMYGDNCQYLHDDNHRLMHVLGSYDPYGVLEARPAPSDIPKVYHMDQEPPQAAAKEPVNSPDASPDFPPGMGPLRLSNTSGAAQGRASV